MRIERQYITNKYKLILDLAAICSVHKIQKQLKLCSFQSFCKEIERQRAMIIIEIIMKSLTNKNKWKINRNKQNALLRNCGQTMSARNNKYLHINFSFKLFSHCCCLCCLSYRILLQYLFFLSSARRTQTVRAPLSAPSYLFSVKNIDANLWLVEKPWIATE